MHLKCLLGHEWHGCICSKCKNTRDVEHDWGKDCEKCTRCGAIRSGAHDWGEDCQKCVRCGKTRTVIQVFKAMEQFRLNPTKEAAQTACDELGALLSSGTEEEV